MKRRTLAVAAAAAWIALLVAVAPAAAASTGMVLSLIRQELVRYGLLNADGTPAAGALSTTGDALSGAGTSGDPLAVAPVLEALVDGGGTATAGAGTVLDLSTTGGLLSGDGSAAAPSMAFSAEPGTGLFRGGAGYAALSLAGAERFGFLVSGGASVLNVLSPFRLAVNGNTVLSYNESDPGVDLGTGGALAFGTGANDPRLVKTGTDEMSVRDGSGNDVTMLAGIFGSKASSNLTIKTGTQDAVVFTYASNPIAGFNGPVVLQNGTATAPSLAFSGSSTSGLYYDSTLGDVGIIDDGTLMALWRYNSQIVRHKSDVKLGWASGAPNSTTEDTFIGRDAADSVALGGGNSQATNIKQVATSTGTLSGASVTLSGVRPAGAMVIGVTVRVTTTITGATSFDIGDGSDVDRYGAAIALTSGTTTTRASSTATPFEDFRASAGDVVLTANGGNFTGGVVRVVVHYIDLTAPGS